MRPVKQQTLWSLPALIFGVILGLAFIAGVGAWLMESPENQAFWFLAFFVGAPSLILGIKGRQAMNKRKDS